MKTTEEKYEDSIFYIINSCSKYFNMLFEQIYKKSDAEISATQHLAMKIISDTKDCSQRDLARLILKDRANTGKLALSLEKKGLIKITPTIKNNRPVKILTITEKGKTLYENIMSKMLPTIKQIEAAIPENIIEETKNTINHFKKIIEENIKIDI